MLSKLIESTLSIQVEVQLFVLVPIQERFLVGFINLVSITFKNV
jgi:hypothetical protein